MPEASYLVGIPDGRFYRLIVRHLYERHRAHVHYVRSDDILARVRETHSAYDDAACRRHLDQLEAWRLVRVLPEQSRPATLLELRNRPRTYQAERVAILLEELRMRLEADVGAASINPTALEQLVRRLEDVRDWVGAGDDHGTPEGDAQAFERWRAAYAAFDTFARGVEDYLGDLPRHRPKELLDYAGFLGYRDALTRYLADYARRLFDRREYVRHLLVTVTPAAADLAAAVGREASKQVRADGSAPSATDARTLAAREVAALGRYFAPGGDVDVLLERAQGWVAEIARHARRLSDQNAGGTVRAELLLDLARRFAGCPDPAAAERLAQVAFGLTLPLHWRGMAPPRDGPVVRNPDEAWRRVPLVVPLQAVRRGRRGRLPQRVTADRTAEELARMLADQAERERTASALAAMFGPHGTVELDALRLDDPDQRQRLLRLLYRALSQNGRASAGYLDWAVAVEGPWPSLLGTVDAPDGRLILPRFRLRLQRGREAAMTGPRPARAQVREGAADG